MNFTEARAIAEQMAREELRLKELPQTPDVLSEHVLEAEGCWLFFMSDLAAGQLTGERRLSLPTAFAVGKTGSTACVYDFREDPKKMNEYLELWSLHALGKEEQAKQALAAFLEKHHRGQRSSEA